MTLYYLAIVTSHSSLYFIMNIIKYNIHYIISHYRHSLFYQQQKDKIHAIY
jgi:hypothetical protein